MISAPSLLAANFGHLAKDTLRAARSGAEWLHLQSFVSAVRRLKS